MCFCQRQMKTFFYFLAKVCYTFRYHIFCFHKDMYTPFFILDVAYKSSLKG